MQATIVGLLSDESLVCVNFGGASAEPAEHSLRRKVIKRELLCLDRTATRLLDRGRRTTDQSNRSRLELAHSPSTRRAYLSRVST